MNIYWASAVSFAFFAIVALMMRSFFNFTGTTWYFLMGILAALGIGSVSIFNYLQERIKGRVKGSALAGGASAAAGAASVPGGAVSAEVDLWIRDANARLAQSRGGAGIANMPMIFIAGDRGTAKTSAILNSGVEPELLAGQIYQENAITPTRGANIFFARDTVFVEAGGMLMAQPGNWKALVAKLQPARLKTGGGLAPRGVVLCFDLEAFTRQGAADAVANAARYLQERLGEISQVLGISFPVYVLFTRGDRLPFFADFVRNLTNEEAGQVVGASLPIRPHALGGVYAEEETQRLTAAFNQLFHSFCDQRLLLLPRETDTERIPGAYEFPREFRKLRNMLVQFLVDLGRPSQLRASPFLRGFYFSGVRPIEMRDVAAAPVVRAATPAPAEVSGATGMFRAGFQAERRAQQGVAQSSLPAGASRRVPQWLFLGHLFNDVILADSAARAASASSVKTSVVKRVLLATAAALCLFYSAMLVMSFFGNRALENNALAAARNIGANEASGATIPSEDALRRLETLRQALAKLTDYKLNGAPFSLRWGLYSGNTMLLPVRRIYYNKFRQLLFGPAQAQMLSFLRNTPPMPGPMDDYGYGYDSLKAYLLTTSEWKRSTDPSLQAFLGSTLTSRWDNGRDAEIGKDRLDLAKLQFDFYSHDLPNGNPYSSMPEAAAVDRTRIYLSRFSGIERVYKFLVAESAKGHPPTNFNRQFPGTAEAVTSTVEVAWAFTRDGWKFMQDQIRKQNFGGEQWVLGNYQAQIPDQATMAKGILDRYTTDYVELWRNVLRRSNVNRYANLLDASRKLTLLTSSSAPLLNLFWWVSQNTAIDLPGVADKFRAAHAVSPPSGAQIYIVPQNQPYNNGLLNLQQAVERAANKDPNGEQAVHDSAQAATLLTKQLSATFPPDPEAHMDQRSGELLEQPIKYLEGMGAEDIRAGGARFCSAFNSLTNKFPFNPSAQPEVSLDELGDILRPKTGKLWTFYESTLKTVMECKNGDCVVKGSTPVNPAFVRFVSQLMKFSHALYGDTGTDPNMQYTLKPLASDQLDEYTVTINAQPVVLKGGEQHSFVWPGAGTRNFRLSLKIAGGTQTDVEPFDGPWSVFRFFADADTTKQSGAGYTFDFLVRLGRSGTPMKVKDRPLVYEFFVDTGGGPAVFSKDFLSTLKCMGPVR